MNNLREQSSSSSYEISDRKHMIEPSGMDILLGVIPSTTLIRTKSETAGLSLSQT